MLIRKKLYYLIIEPFLMLFYFFFKGNDFLIITPRPLSFLIGRVVIFNKLKNCFFYQSVRNYFDINTVYQIFGYEEYNLKKIRYYKLLKKYLSNKKLFIDCGSNIGSVTRYFSEIYNNSLIYSIEPDIENFIYLKKNNFSNNIIYLNNAVAYKNLNFSTVKKKDPRAHKIKLKNSNTKKKTITINEILKDDKCKSFIPFLIKIDIEGFEKNLFQKNFQWINKFKIIIIELHDWMEPTKSISQNFINALSKTIKNKPRDLILNGENLISIRNDK